MNFKYIVLTRIILTLFFCWETSINAQTFAECFRGTTEDDDNGQCLARDAAGNVYVGGNFRTTVDFDPGAGTANLTTGQVTGNGNMNGFVGKYTSAGAYTWAFKLGNGVSGEQTVVYGIAVDGSGDVFVTGQLQGTVDFDPGAGTANLTSAGVNDIFIAKYSTAGAYQWAIRAGAASNDRGYAITVDASSNLYITGYFMGTVDFDPSAGTANLVSAGNEDGFVASYTSAGAYRWAFGFGGANTEISNKIQLDAAETSLFICGSFQRTVDFNPGAGTNNLSSSTPASTIDVDGFVAKYTTAAGAYVWASKIGGNPATTSKEESLGLALDASDNVYICGTMVSATVDISGTTLTKIGTLDTYYAKYNSSGTLQWAKNIGTASNSVTGYDLYVESTKVYIVGNFTSTIDFDPNAGVENGTSNGSLDMFFSEYNTADGSFVCKSTIGGTSIDYAKAVIGDGLNIGSFYVVGWFRGTNIDFDPSTGSLLLSSGSAGAFSDVFLGRYTVSAVGAGCLIILPVEYSKFEVKCAQNQNTLTWVTLAEINNDYFTIERSDDGRNWEVIKSIHGSGNSNMVNTYYYTDEDLISSIYYYRLKQTDFNGKYSYSTIVSANCEELQETDFSIFPNPSQGSFSVSYKNELDKPVSIEVANVLGESVYRSNNLQQNIDLSTHSNGVYFVHLFLNNKKLVKKIIIQK